MTKTATVQFGGARRRRLAMIQMVVLTTSIVAMTGPARSQPRPTAAMAAPVVQINGNPLQMPMKRPVSRTSGLILKIDPRWSNSYGYHPVQVTVASPAPSKRDRVVRIQLHSGWMSSVCAEQTIELPAGSASVTATVSLPVFQSPSNNYMWWDVWVDGVKDKDLSADRSSSFAWMGRSTGVSSNLSFLVAGLPGSDRVLVATNATEFEVLSLTLGNFPTRWIDYTAFDVVALSLPEVELLRTQQPEAFNAIYRWVHAGGQLWIGDAGNELENVPAISKLLRLSEKVEPIETQAVSESQAAANPDEEQKADEEVETVEPPQVERAWRPLRFRGRSGDGRVVTFFDSRIGTRRTTRDPEVIARLQQDPNFVISEEKFEPVATMPERRFAADSTEWFVEQDLGLGTVRAFRGANEVAAFAQTPPTQNANAAANSDAPDEFSRALAMGLRRTLRWDSRHGMSPDAGNAEFAKLLVPGVGLAPVTEFEVLITLFVVVIGPVNYWLLRKFKRLHLLVLTVPLAAAITTLSLFAYAVVADGFSSRVRTYSYTSLDQRSGEAACWARISYYTGLAPSAGLDLPADLVMYPIQPAWGADTRYAEERFIVWEGNKEKLTRGWLNSRTPTQYLSVRSRKSPHRLEVLDSGETVRVKNELGAVIKSLYVVNDAGKMFTAENIAAAATAPLTPINRDDAIRLLTKQIADNAPRAPEALDASESDLAALQPRSRFNSSGRWGSQYNTGQLSANLAAEAIADLAGLGDHPALALPPRSYVAITETGPEVETGIPNAVEEASFHLIEGTW